MVDPVTISGLFSVGKSLIERLWPDPAKQAEEMRKLQELEQEGDLARLNAHVQLMVAQLKINEAEAAHKSIFVAGWRPFIGWVGGCSLAWQFLCYPMLLWAWAIWAPETCDAENVCMVLDPPPVFETGPLLAIVTAMLGIGGMRSFDKTRGTATQRINQ